MRTFDVVSAVRTGFAQDELVVAELEPAAHGYSDQRAGAFLDALADRARALPQVADVALADNAPFFIGVDRRVSIWPETGACEPEPCRTVPAFTVSAGYFRTLGAPLVAGREFRHDRETPAAEVVVNAPLARQLWPSGDAVGRTMRIGADGAAMVVVGVSGPMKTRGLDREEPTMFLPLGPAAAAGRLAMVVRSERPGQLVRPIVDAAYAIDSRVAIRQVQTMRERMALQLWPFRTLGWVSSICAALALLMAMTGLVAVVAHAVSRRTREFGVRIALGATSLDVAADVLRSGVALLVPGLMAGLLAAAAAARLARAAFVGVDVLDPRVYAGVAALLGVTVLLACLVPALRSTRITPLAALRQE